jgi:hypothetical protein
MRILSLALVLTTAPWSPTDAQVQPSDETSRLVFVVTEAFFDQLVKEDFQAERNFLSPTLTDGVSAKDWETLRRQTIDLAGKTRRYSAHGMTYYQEKNLLAAVDFHAAAERPETWVCGFLLWELASETEIGLLRFEQNVVDLPVFRQMPVETAAQTMVNFRCPVDMIERELGVSLE